MCYSDDGLTTTLLGQTPILPLAGGSMCALRLTRVRGVPLAGEAFYCAGPVEPNGD
jgi:hypothetical protein